MSLNTWVGIGNLTRAPELRKTNGDVSVCGFSIAINEKFGEKEHVSFIDCTAFRGLADNVAKYCDKGSKVAVEGALRMESWVGKDGQNKTKLKIMARNVQFLSAPAAKKEEQEERPADMFPEEAKPSAGNEPWPF